MHCKRKARWDDAGLTPITSRFARARGAGPTPVGGAVALT
jgi:hypothetical protein